MSLALTVAETKPCMFVITLTGSLDSATYAVLEKKIGYLIAEGKARVITLDMAALAFISSMGVRVILTAKKNLRPNQGSLCMINVPPPIQKVFEIINALPSMTIFASVEEMDAYLANMQQRQGGGPG